MTDVVTGRHHYRIILLYKLPLQSVMLGLGLGQSRFWQLALALPCLALAL